MGNTKKKRHTPEKNYCEKPKYMDKDPLECFLMTISGMLKEHQTISEPERIPVRGNITTKHTNDPSDIYIIKMDVDNKSLQGLRDKINKILLKCNNYAGIIKFIRCHIMKETKGKKMLDELGEIEIDKSVDVSKLEQSHPIGYDIFIPDELKIIEIYGKKNGVIHYLLNVLKMIFQDYGMGYFVKLNSDKLKELAHIKMYTKKKQVNNNKNTVNNNKNTVNREINNDNMSKDNMNNDINNDDMCNQAIIKCETSGFVRDVRYLMGVSERAIIYDLFLPDESFMDSKNDLSG